MMLPEDIKNYNKQFDYEPVVENAAKLKKFSKFLVVGMGGSHLAADIIKAWHPELDIIVWSDYGLPKLGEKELKERLIILSSYSGSTEETLDALAVAKAKKFSYVIVASRGKLISLAERNKVPYVQLPTDHALQPRMATPLSMKAMLALMGERTLLAEAKLLALALHPLREEYRGKELARKIYGNTPIIYTAFANAAIANNWKIKFNETGKIPAFSNVVPELNHNEMTGFDVKTKTLPLSRNFHFIFLKDGDDDRRITKRMNVLEKLYRDRGFKTEVVLMQGKTRIGKIFNSLNLADWTAYHSAKMYGVEPEQVPMVEEFKKLIARNT
jgi:glucose/mannose-6-phosphate isomerase